MRYIEIESNKSLSRDSFLLYSALDNPRDMSAVGSSNLIVSGWVLGSDITGTLPDMYIDVDGLVSRVLFTIDRPDVIRSILKVDNDARLKCGFKEVFTVKERAEVYFFHNSEKISWKTINVKSLSAISVLNNFKAINTNFANFHLSGDAVSNLDRVGEIEWNIARVRTFKGFDSYVYNKDSEKYHLNDDDLVREHLDFGSFIDANFITLDNRAISLSGCIGDKDALRREFVSFEFPRDDLSVLEKSTDVLMKSDMDLLNLKKLIIRLRRAKRAKKSRLEFIGFNYDYAQQDLEKIREICTKFFPIIKELIGIRYLWSIIDCFADFGTAIERGQALAISNFMQAERMMQSLHTIYDLREKDNIILDKQFSYWGGMFANRLLEDDSLDVFLTRSVELLSGDPLLYACFCEIILESAYSKGSLIEENLRRSEYFKHAFEEYETVFRHHIATLHLTVPSRMIGQ